MGGYAMGMLLTLAMLLVFNRGQPALLYLVPCVTGAAWLTGAVRGELHDMLTYTEDGSLDTEDVVVEVDARRNVVTEISRRGTMEMNGRGEGNDEIMLPGAGAAGNKNESTTATVGESTGSKADSRYDMLVFSITAPRQRAVQNGLAETFK
jgi:minor histocompatibility antigen H13